MKNMDSPKLQELVHRVLFVLGAIVIFRVGSFVPVPGIDPSLFSDLFDKQSNNILGFLNMFSGGALSRFSIFAMGVMPYISASIIIQLMSAVVPQFEQLKKEGAQGRRKLSLYTRYLTLALCIFQSFGITLSLARQGVVIDPTVQFYVTSVLSLVTGTMFLMWLGEQVTERGIGNGISLIIFSGIVAGLPSAIGGVFEQARQGEIQPITLLLILLIVLLVTAFVVFVERGQRRIPIQYARRTQGNKVYQGQSSHLPLKLNMAGVIPPIFASSLILFPATLTQWFGDVSNSPFLSAINYHLSPGQPVYIAIYASAIVFFCYFYTAIVFTPKDTAKHLKREGAFVPGIRPGQQTSNYLDGVITRLTTGGALYITMVCLLPEFLILAWNVPFNFGGTSLLIIVVVVMDFITQLQTHMLSYQYESLMKKKSLRYS